MEGRTEKKKGKNEIERILNSIVVQSEKISYLQKRFAEQFGRFLSVLNFDSVFVQYNVHEVG